jgi:Histone deacetylation protein Rxt3
MCSPQLFSFLFPMLHMRHALPQLVLSAPWPPAQVKARQLWGDKIYTDDSDVVAVLMHLGYYGMHNPSQVRWDSCSHQVPSCWWNGGGNGKPKVSDAAPSYAGLTAHSPRLPPCATILAVSLDACSSPRVAPHADRECHHLPRPAAAAAAARPVRFLLPQCGALARLVCQGGRLLIPGALSGGAAMAPGTTTAEAGRVGAVGWAWLAGCSHAQQWLSCVRRLL